ncbi:MAG: hypothetical protein JXQ67_00505 [Campylobacterales bacterium]|nr:hypothetical protein [Campylobacterales bacterium]
MVKIGKFFAYLLFFIFSLLLFVPKESVYFLFEGELKKFDVVISNELREESLLSLQLHNLDISAKGVESVHAKSAEVTLLLLYNRVELESIEISEVLQSYVPTQIEHLSVVYSLINPLNVVGEARGEFGEAKLVFDLVERKVFVTLEPTDKMLKEYKSIMRMFQKAENGEYTYAKAL